MDHREAGRYWNANAEAWTQLSRAGYDLFRDHLNTPAFLELLPEVSGLHGLDIGCGEGHNTRLLAAIGARVTAIDFSEAFLRHAQSEEVREPVGIRYVRASAVELPFPDATFDFATAFMSLMEFPETRNALSEAWRVLKPGGFLQFSITHPCFNTVDRENLRDEKGIAVGVQLGDYFAPCTGQIASWTFSDASEEVRGDLPLFQVPDFRRTLSEWVDLLVECGFQIQAMQEPCPSDDAIARYPKLRPSRIAPLFMHFRAKKPPVSSQ